LGQQKKDIGSKTKNPKEEEEVSSEKDKRERICGARWPREYHPLFFLFWPVDNFLRPAQSYTLVE
jgi:hypothetical protein